MTTCDMEEQEDTTWNLHDVINGWSLITLIMFEYNSIISYLISIIKKKKHRSISLNCAIKNVIQIPIPLNITHWINSLKKWHGE